MRARAAFLAVAAAVAGCAGVTEPPVTASEPPPTPTVTAKAPPAPPPTEAERAIASTLERVAEARGLPIKRSVRGLELDRSEIVERMRTHVEEDVPPEVIRAQGDGLVLLALAPLDYDFMEGILALVEGRIAGFYEPKDGTMYLLSDLDEEDAEQTLSHELVHALQDQSFGLAPMLKYRPGGSDRASAAQALIEGDATSAMFDLSFGSAFQVSDERFRFMLEASSAMSSVGATTPPVLQRALNAPYADGLPFVKALRTLGGYAAVDEALRSPPTTTEQALHIDKFLAREPPAALPTPPLTPLGPGFEATLDDPMGEQGLRLVLEEWTTRPKARRAAAGWGGDRYLVAQREEPSGDRQIALAWHLRMDTPQDAAELAEAVGDHLGKPCAERADLGPIAWRHEDRDVVIVAGPSLRAGAAVTSASACKTSRAWIAAILAAPR